MASKALPPKGMACSLGYGVPSSSSSIARQNPQQRSTFALGLISQSGRIKQFCGLTKLLLRPSFCFWSCFFHSASSCYVSDESDVPSMSVTQEACYFSLAASLTTGVHQSVRVTTMSPVHSDSVSLTFTQYT